MFPIFVPKCLVKASADFVFCEYRKQKPGAMDRHRLVLLLLYVSALELIRNAAVVAQIREKRLAFFQNSKCTYSYELAVHTARGSKSTESDGYQLHALVDVIHVSREINKERFLHLCKLSVRQPRLRRMIHGHVTRYPVIEQFEEQLSKPFYFRQWDHGPVLDVLFPKATESAQVAALKKGNIMISPCT
ncbi:unnamed protein product [Porites lobata]|uniref:Uncharacterized protein n=1 Tax=Porites lobata TaxID=104759 RepID=A0ABN8PK00_9CNID|nr:unnamed protein product [Porites lobata]